MTENTLEAAADCAVENHPPPPRPSLSTVADGGAIAVASNKVEAIEWATATVARDKAAEAKGAGAATAPEAERYTIESIPTIDTDSEAGVPIFFLQGQ